MRKNLSTATLIMVVVLVILTSSSCQQAPSPTSNAIGVTPSVIVIPSDTPIPMAVVINGEGITKAEFEAEMARFQSAQTELGNSVTLENATQRVLDDFINQVLLKQGADAAGFVVDDAILQTRMDDIVAQVGGVEALVLWQQENGYNDETLRTALKRQIAVAWMRDHIAETVPVTAEQVHVQQILSYNQESAQDAWNQLNSGADFDDLALTFDPITKGELGWFPRNYLPDIQIEEAAFALQPGEFSQVIETIAGYSILKVLEKEMDHLLSPDALMTLQIHAIQTWLSEQRSVSDVQISP